MEWGIAIEVGEKQSFLVISFSVIVKMCLETRLKIFINKEMCVIGKINK